MTQTALINGFNGRYMVNIQGEVFSFATGKLVKLKEIMCTSGYKRVTLYPPNTTGRRVYRRIHRVVAEHFIPNPENKPCINHKDGDKLNNTISNLEWCTYRENAQHAIKVGLTPLKQRTLTLHEFNRCKELYLKSELTWESAANKFGVTRRALDMYLNELSAEDAKQCQLKQQEKKRKGAKAAGEKTSKPVLQLSIDDRPIRKWKSLIAAAKALGIGQGNISNVLAGRQITTGGYKWQWV